MDELNLWTVLAQIINFLILFLLFKIFLSNKIAKMVIDRKEKLKSAVEIISFCFYFGLLPIFKVKR